MVYLSTSYTYASVFQHEGKRKLKKKNLTVLKLISCFPHADQIMPKLPTPHTRLSGPALLQSQNRSTHSVS